VRICREVERGKAGNHGCVVENATRPDLIWDDEARGLCLRVYGDDSKSFIFVYRIGDRQRFIRIGTSPPWSLEAARARAKELRPIVDQGRDPAAGENRGREIPPVTAFPLYRCAIWHWKRIGKLYFRLESHCPKCLFVARSGH
jgi:hypothetical protein